MLVLDNIQVSDLGPLGSLVAIYREVDINYITPKNNYNQFFFLRSNLSFGRVKDTSHGPVTFTQPKHMLLCTVVKIYHE